jgi:hypothetical protein
MSANASNVRTFPPAASIAICRGSALQGHALEIGYGASRMYDNRSRARLARNCAQTRPRLPTSPCDGRVLQGTWQGGGRRQAGRRRRRRS